MRNFTPAAQPVAVTRSERRSLRLPAVVEASSLPQSKLLALEKKLIYHSATAT